jgi:hypothetical protein
MGMRECGALRMFSITLARGRSAGQHTISVRGTATSRVVRSWNSKMLWM